MSEIQINLVTFGAPIFLSVKKKITMVSHSRGIRSSEIKHLEEAGTLQPELLCNENIPSPKSWQEEFSVIFPRWIEHQGRGTSQVPTILASAILFTTSVASVTWVTLTHPCVLWPHCLVSPWLCETKAYKEIFLVAGSLSVPPSQLYPHPTTGGVSGAL